jgi:hypothetical protein
MNLLEINKALQAIEEQLKESPDEENPDLRKELLDLFSNGPIVTDKEVHAIATKRGIDPSEVEDEVYQIVIDLLHGQFLKNWDVPDSEFDPEQLKKGIAIEMEHTDNPAWAKAIAKTHLKERKDYYILLDKYVEKK